MFLILSKAITGNSRSGYRAVMGIGCGLLVHVFLTAFGLSAILYASEVALQTFKYVGAAYLLYLSWKILTESVPQTLEHDKKMSAAPAYADRRSFVQGFLTNVLNPKAALFVMALLPQFVVQGATPIWLQILVLGSTLVCVAVVTFSCVVALSATIRQRVLRNPVAAAVQRWVSGLLLGGSAIILIGSDLRK